MPPAKGGGMEIKMRIAICESKRQSANELLTLIQGWGQGLGCNIEVQIFLTAEQFLFAISEKQIFELAFLDTDIKQIRAIELARFIRRENEHMLLIFTTNDIRLAIKGYEVSAYWYLIKPLDKRQVEKVLNQATKEIEKNKRNAIIISQDREITRVWKQDIRYIEADGHYLKIYAKEKIFKIREKMDTFSKKLEEPQFCRCHRAFICNLYYLESFTGTDIRMQGDIMIPVSKNRQKVVEEYIYSYYKHLL